MRRAGAIALTLALTLSGGLVRAAEVPDACLIPATDLDMTLAGLERAGWQVVPGGTLPPEVAELLVWSYATQYLTGDSGGEPLDSILTLQRRTVEGLARKRDIPTSKTRLLQRDGAALAVFWRVPEAGMMELQCRGAMLEAGADVPDTVIGTLARQEVDGGAIMILPLDAAALTAEIGGLATVPTAVLDSYIRFEGEPSL
ncbi:hypothetical protein [Jannaschia sp. M317]|uniref:hypothetical protein n=1 Tax=Jannaschia sp. M317 TaxID=2867011 RepID=UPI0021A4E5FA|nr:hypothetical protein [Jannaschia sp. M317]UWQ18029.1 hypothetical protein K3551_01605 [Jannaschia sp. M317]